MNNSLFDLIQMFIVNYPGISACKSSDFVVMACNQYTASITGFKNPAELIGKTDYEIKCEAVNYADKFRSQDKKIIARKLPTNYLDINHYKNGTRILFTEKKCLQDSKGEILGILYYGSDITSDFDRIDYLKSKGIITFNDLRMESKTFELVDSFDERLNKEENICLFYMLQYKSEKEIGKFVNLSRSRLNEHILRIADVMDCDNLAQIIEKSISLNYLDMLPKALIKDCLGQSNNLY